MNTFLSGRETVAAEFVKDDKICTMVSSMGLRWGFDTGTHQWNTAQEPGKSAIKKKKTKTKTKT